MAQHRKPQDEPSGKQEEARHLAEEAVEAAREGDKEESKFLAHEAEALDKAAAEDVLKSGAKKPSG